MKYIHFLLIPFLLILSSLAAAQRVIVPIPHPATRSSNPCYRKPEPTIFILKVKDGWRMYKSDSTNTKIVMYISKNAVIWTLYK